MIKQTSNAGPFRLVNAQTLSPGDRETRNTREEAFGPRNQQGYLKKFYGQRGGFDFIEVTNSSNVPINVRADGNTEFTVPPASSTVVTGAGPDGTVDQNSTAYTSATIINPSFNTTDVDPNDVAVHFGNMPRPEESGGSNVRFDPLSIIPGLSSNGR